ncbi:MAG: PLP-dependent aminotransferase family protein [Coriobacteriaceae bacterium]|nr:PLP-dependent aminotransferase family protein [Coriobacteriaceae bacterium]
MKDAHIKFETAPNKVAARITKMRPSAVRLLFAAATREDVISLAGGMPDVSLLPKRAVRKAAKAAIENQAVTLQYGGTNGVLATAQVFCDMVRDIGIRHKAENVILTTGAQEALDLVAKTFCDPGDIIITEGPTYLGALQAFSAYEPDIRTVEFDDEGMRMDLLEEELKRIGKGNPKLKFLYTIPNFQNPGGVTMSPERRKRLLELSHEYDFIVVEDDPYGRLRYEGGHCLPLRALDDSVIYLGTISKTFAAGLRVGYIMAPPGVIGKINLAKQGTDLCGSVFDQVMAAAYYTDTPWQNTLQKFVKTYDKRRRAMFAAMEEYFPPEATWTHPEGGFFVWVTLPEYVDANSMLAEALDHGVIYAPGDAFYPDGKRGRNSMRLNFSFESPENITEAIRRLAEVIEDRLELYRAFIAAGAIKE